MMLGNEYNWLISLSSPPVGAPRVRIARTGMLTLAVAVFCFFCVAAHAEPPHRTLMREAVAAAKAGDNTLLIAKLEVARALRPDYPRVLYSLTRGYAVAGRTDDALAQLRELAAMGLSFDAAQDPALAALRDRPEFGTLIQAFAANRGAQEHHVTAKTIPGMDGIIEGLAHHPLTGSWYFSDVRNRCIWFRDGSSPEAPLKQFSADSDRLAGVFGLKIDEARNSLWAGTAALPEMKGFTDADKGHAALVEFDLATGRVRRSFAVPPDGRDHVLGDVLLAPDGSVFATDSTAPVVWRLAPDGTKLEKWLENSEFLSLQGLAFAEDGKSLLVADYANGLWEIDLASQVCTLLPAPPHTTLFGIDGIYAVPGGLVAVQNGITPQRIVRIDLADGGQPAAVKVLLSGHAAMTDSALGQINHGRFQFIGNSGWSLYEDPKSAPAARDLTVLETNLP